MVLEISTAVEPNRNTIANNEKSNTKNFKPENAVNMALFSPDFTAIIVCLIDQTQPPRFKSRTPEATKTPTAKEYSLDKIQVTTVIKLSNVAVKIYVKGGSFILFLGNYLM